jgi:replicative DNA helicase
VESRTPPHNLDAEKSVLGSVLLDNDVFAALEGTLHPDDFYKEGHRKIFRGMDRLYRRSEPMDLVTLTEELRQAGELEAVGSVPYLIGLADSVPTAAYAESYAKIVREKSVLRALIGASGQIMQRAYEQAVPLEDVLDEAEAAIFELATSKRRSFFESMPLLVTETFQHINELFANPDPVSGLRMGFKELDGLTAGLQRSSLNVLAARPSMGKTAFALTIALNAALREHKPVGIFSLEMSAVQLVTRMLCSEARVDMSRVRSGQLSDRDFQRLADTAGRMSESSVFIDDNADLTVMELRSRARRLMAEHDLGLIVIDYLQLMSGSSRSQSENRQQEISVISRGLKALARELDVPVLVLSQLSRAVEARPNKRPLLSDLRECVTGDTPVLLADGGRVPIRELVGTTPRVLAVDGRGRVVSAASDRVWEVGTRPVLELRLASGRRLRATARHRCLTRDGWRRLDALVPGTAVALARRAPAPAAGVRWDEGMVARLGRSLAHRECPTHATLPPRDHSVMAERTDAECIPRGAFRLVDEQVALLLRHAWGAAIDDRCATASAGAVDLIVAGRGLATDMAALLLRLGIVAAIEHAGGACRVRVLGAAMRRRFLAVVLGRGATADEPPVHHAGRAPLAAAITPAAARGGVAVLAERGGGSAAWPTTTSVGGRPMRAADRPPIADDSDWCDDLHWDQVVALEPAGEAVVYDLTVPGPTSWLADGVVSHNSGAIEQDADLVMFIYRDEYYDPHSEKQGIAEVIIGKQRNGPVGSVDLQFHSAHVRFNDLARSGVG